MPSLGAKTSVFAPYKRLILAHRVVTPETTQSAGSRLHLALELIEKAPIRVLGDQRLWARLYQARLLQRSPWRHLGSKVPGPLPSQRGSRNLGSDPQPPWSALKLKPACAPRIMMSWRNDDGPHVPAVCARPRRMVPL